MENHQVSQRKACSIVGIHRATLRTRRKKHTAQDPDRYLRKLLREFSDEHPCCGFKRAHAYLVHDLGMQINIKKVNRLWREEGLLRRQHTRRKPRGCSTAPKVVKAQHVNHVWSIDFQFDVTADGRPFKIVSMIDEYTRESLIDVVDRSVDADRLCMELAKVFATRGTPKVLRMDNGPEFISQRLRRMCAGQVDVLYIPPGTPWNNGFVESFNRRRRAECLHLHVFGSLLEAQVMVREFHREHNTQHRHSSLGYLTPSEFAASVMREEVAVS